MYHLVRGEADDAAREPSAGVARRLARLPLRPGLGVIARAEVVLELVDHARAADDRVGARERNLRVLDLKRAPVLRVVPSFKATSGWSSKASEAELKGVAVCRD